MSGGEDGSAECLGFARCGNMITPREARLHSGFCADCTDRAVCSSCFSEALAEAAREISERNRKEKGN